MQELSKGAAQAGIAIDIARQLESTLEAFGATGKGLHEKISSIEGKLPEALGVKLRFVASVRNKIVHEDNLLSDKDFTAFVEAGKQAVGDLKDAVAGGKAGTVPPRPKPRRKTPPRPASVPVDGFMAGAARTARLAGAVFLGGIVLVFLLMVLGNDGPVLWGGAFIAYSVVGWHLLRKSRRTPR